MTDEELTRFLFVREDPVPADLIMVFAYCEEEELERRTRRGVELYHQGYAPKLLVTGGGVLARRQPEAKRMAQIARELGVPGADLLVEDQSDNTFRNVLFSVRLLHDGELLARLKTVILVSSEWHMQRVRLTTRKYFPRGVRLVCCPTLECCHRDNWTASAECREAVTWEAQVLQRFLDAGVLLPSSELADSSELDPRR